MDTIGKQLLSASQEIMRLNKRVYELEDAIRKHKENNPSIDHGIYWWRRDTELYRILEAK